MPKKPVERVLTNDQQPVGICENDVTEIRTPFLTDPYSSGTEIAEYLAQFGGAGSVAGQPYVHPRAISFNGSGDRADWRPHMPDADARDTFSTFYNTGKRGKKTWVGFFSVPTGMMIGNHWKDANWHCYTIAVIAKPAKGKVLVIWDCDPKAGVGEGARIKDVLFGKQRALVEFIRNDRKVQLEVWYNIDDSLSGNGRCLEKSLKKLSDWVTLGDLPFSGSDDPRVAKCIQLRF